mmetsp:Transcript_17626/g.54899  ORF Transcript_17626/g.54899 Transcript_17626/m.54899 type:complete len:241 (+) Transcript_17626:304-1026(+)
MPREGHGEARGEPAATQAHLRGRAPALRGGEVDVHGPEARGPAPLAGRHHALRPHEASRQQGHGSREGLAHGGGRARRAAARVVREPLVGRVRQGLHRLHRGPPARPPAARGDHLLLDLRLRQQPVGARGCHPGRHHRDGLLQGAQPAERQGRRGHRGPAGRHVHAQVVRVRDVHRPRLLLAPPLRCVHGARGRRQGGRPLRRPRRRRPGAASRGRHVRVVQGRAREWLPGGARGRSPRF